MPKPDELQDTDVMLVLHKDENDMIADLLWKVLEKPKSDIYTLDSRSKRLVLNILKHMGEIK